MTRNKATSIALIAVALAAIGIVWEFGSPKVEAPAIENVSTTASNQDSGAADAPMTDDTDSSVPAATYRQLVIENPRVVYVGDMRILLNASDFEKPKNPTFEPTIQVKPKDRMYYDAPIEMPHESGRAVTLLDAP